MSVGLIISLVLAALLLLSVGLSFWKGYRKGLFRTSVRAGMFVLFMIIAGLITKPISNALLKIDISSLNLEVNGAVAQTIPEYISQSVLSTEEVASFANEVPSILSFVESAPSIIVSIVVFMLLVPIMTFLSWAVYRIVYDLCLPIGRAERKAKKLEKLNKKRAKAGSKGQLANPEIPVETVVVNKPKKYKWWGAGVGAVYGFILIFVSLLPITSLFSTFSSVTQTTTAVLAEDDHEILTETAGDLAKYYLGEETYEILSAYGNSVAGKILTIGGLDDAIFDAITSVKINNEKISLRKDIETVASIYNECVLIVDGIGQAGTYKTIDFNKVNEVCNKIFHIGILRAVMPEALPYVANYICESEEFAEIDYHEQIKEAIDGFIENLKNSEGGFMNTLEKDFSSAVAIVQSACEVGLVDDLVGGKRDSQTILNALSAEEYKLLNSVSKNLTNSQMFKAIVSNTTTAALSIFASSEGENVDFGKVELSKVDWVGFETSFNQFLRNALDIAKIVTKQDVEELLENPKLIVENSTSAQLKQIVVSLGKELDILKNSNLFKNQEKNAYNEIVSYFSNKDEFSKYLDATTLKNVSWESEFGFVANVVCALKDSGLLEEMFDEDEFTLENAVNKLSKTDANGKTYVSQVLTSVLDMQLSQKPFKQILTLFNENIEKVREKIGEEVVEIDLTNFTCLSATDKQNLVSAVENLSIGIEKIGLEKIVEQTIDAIFDLNNTENGVANSKYVADALTSLSKVGVTKQTLNSIFVAAGNKEAIKQYATLQAAAEENFSWNDEFEVINQILTILERQHEYVTIKDVLFPGGKIEVSNLSMEDVSSIMNNLASDIVPNTSAMKALVGNLYNSKIFKQLLVYLINTTNAQVANAISSETTTYEFSKIEIANLTTSQQLQIINVMETLAKAFDTLTDDNFDFEKLSNDEIVLVGNFLNALKENAFNVQTVDGTKTVDPRCVASADGKTVENGGVFAEVYMAMIDYAKQTYSFEGNLSYATIEWVNFLKTAQKLSKLSSGGVILDVISDTSLDVKEVLEIAGVGQETSTKVENIQSSFEGVKENSAQAYENLASSLDEISSDNANEIKSKINEITGKDVSEAVSIDAIQKEKAVSARISSLLTTGLNDSNFDEALSDLCNGATVVLTQAVANGTVLANNMETGNAGLLTQIGLKTSDAKVIGLVKALFQID